MREPHAVKVGSFLVGEKQPLAVISGPCVIESEALALETAEALVAMCEELGIPLIYKSSYDKANRSSFNSFRGPGLHEGLKILKKVKETFNIPVTTDIHEMSHIFYAAEVCDILQIPAFLCRQTDLLVAAADSKRVINVKKGQFMAPWDMKNVVEKILEAGNSQIILTDRGTSFGYNNLVSDFRAIPIMKKFGFPVCFDASHSVQLPGGLGSSSGGQREFIPTLAKASIAAGANLLFIESHPRPNEAKSDAASVISFDELKPLLKVLLSLHQLLEEPAFV